MQQVYGEDSYLHYYPLMLYSIVPIIASAVYTSLAKALNDFEEHPTHVQKKNALVLKVIDALLQPLLLLLPLSRLLLRGIAREPVLIGAVRNVCLIVAKPISKQVSNMFASM